jgi:holo-ACP synthase
MTRNLFLEGSQPSLEEVLQTRENRVRFQETLAVRYSPDTVISFKLNIPGPVKNNESIQNIFSVGRVDILEALTAMKCDILYGKEMNLNTGPEFFLVVNAPIDEVKSVMIGLEEEKALGRLYDLDVFMAKGDEIRTMSREELGFSERRCLICGKSAKACGRNRTHEISEMNDRIMEMMETEKRL